MTNQDESVKLENNMLMRNRFMDWFCVILKFLFQSKLLINF